MDAVLFDYAGVMTSQFIPTFDDVQFDADRLLVEMAEAMGATSGESGAEHPWHEVERGERSLDNWIDWIEQRVPGSAEMFATDSPNNAMGRLTLLDERIQLARDLAELGLEVGVVTNNVAEWEPLWRPRLPDDLFTCIVDSAAVQMRKPEKRMYEFALSLLATRDPGRVVFIDDFVWNVEGARDAGMAAIHLETSTDLVAELQNLGIAIGVE